jgi:hypothetical protein
MVVKLLFQNLLGGTEEYHRYTLARVAGLWAENPAQVIMNMKQEC